jgi:hypothetical protein
VKLLAPAVTVFAAVTALSLFSTPSARAAHPVEPAAPCLPGQPPAGHPRDDSGHRTELSTELSTAPQTGEQTLEHGGPAATTTSFRAVAAAGSATTVRVFAHVLRTAKGGGISDHRVRRQVSILNQAYAGKQSGGSARSPFSFRLVQIDRTTNANWYRMDQGTVSEAHAKRALHRGNADDLNLYIGMNKSGSLGWATQPGSYARGPKLDGVVIRRTTMAGGKPGHYSWGDVAVHETGHWLGLLHTFAGGCSVRGDLVADTPREARPSYTCPLRRNTCTAPGRDPVRNFMDYSYDRCMNQFTPGQVARMRQQWWSFRAGGT